MKMMSKPSLAAVALAVAIAGGTAYAEKQGGSHSGGSGGGECGAMDNFDRGGGGGDLEDKLHARKDYDPVSDSLSGTWVLAATLYNRANWDEGPYYGYAYEFSMHDRCDD